MSAEMIGFVAACAALVGTVAGVVVGISTGRRLRAELGVENAQLRAALRYARGVSVERGLRPLARYIERVLDEATGT